MNMFKVKFIFVRVLGFVDVGIMVMINVMNVKVNNNVYFIYDFYGLQFVINKVVFGVSVFVYRSYLYSIQMVVYWVNLNDVVVSINYIGSYWNVVWLFVGIGDVYQNYIDKDMFLCVYYGLNLNVFIVFKKKWDFKNVFNFFQSILVNQKSGFF